MSNEAHKMIISGCITKIGEASTGSPCGADGRFVVFTQDAAKKCASTFIGMPLNCTYPDGWFSDGTELFTGHGTTNIGYIRNVSIDGDNLMAEMVVWKDKFSDEAWMIFNGADALGFSVEWYPTVTHVEDDTEYMDEFEGCGCAILWKNVAAFSQTFIDKIAAARSDVEMTEKEKQEFTELINASIDSKFAEVKASIDEIKASKESIEASIEEIKAKPVEMPEDIKASIDEVKASLDEVKSKSEAVDETINELKASKGQPVIPQPKAGQYVEPNPVLASDGKDDVAKINASSMSPLEKIKEIAKIRAGKN